MKTISKIQLRETNQFSNLFLDYVHHKTHLQSFISENFDLKSFSNQINSKIFSNEKRVILFDCLNEQYENASIIKNKKTENNIKLLLDSKTFTITTGHQICLMTGPIYFIFKIITTINLAKKLKIEFPDYNFVPIYWMASEDHDFEEINHFNLFGKKIAWQTEQNGAVGRMDTKGIFEFIEPFLKNKDYCNHYKNNSNLADATLSLVNELFENEGLLVINPDNKSLKEIFKSNIVREIFNQKVSYDDVNLQSKKLEDLGYKSQINPREINLFYLKNNLRERIIFENEVYKILNTNLQFTVAEMQMEITNFPERFSPNVILRPLYQETILPNIAYVGGPGELAYWLQLKTMFDSINVSFPILIPRNFACIVSNSIQKKITKLGFKIEDFFMDKSKLKKIFIDKNSSQSIDFEKEKFDILEKFKITHSEIIKIDGSLIGFAESQAKEIENIFVAIQKKIQKAKELKESVNLTQIDAIYSKLFPENILQERHENIFSFLENDSDFIQKLVAIFDPFCKEMYILGLD